MKSSKDDLRKRGYISYNNGCSSGSTIVVAVVIAVVLAVVIAIGL